MTKQIDYNNTSWGYGFKYGGFLIASGMETTEGYILDSKSLAWCERFTLTNARLGLGLGGGIGAVAVIAFNAPSLTALDGMEMTDWGVNIAMGKKISAMVNSMAKSHLLPSDMEDICNGLHYLHTQYDIASRGNAPKIVSFDLGGVGAELSLNYVTGKFEVEWGVAA